MGIGPRQQSDDQYRLLLEQKLETARRMATTLAHEINNPLAATMNSLYLVLQDQSLSKSTRQKLKLAEREVKRIAHLTRQALGFYEESGPPSSVELSELVDGVLDLCASKLASKSIQVIREHHGVSHVCAIEGELRQIISNLVANGIDAVPDNGTIHIRTTCPMSVNGIPMMRLTVADTGAGISQENLNRIFEAFFTTKQSVGTGLGLWATRELVNKHKGTIRVRSVVGRGSVFTVWIPTAY
jgi:signal transduction histidine kinase